MNVTLMCGVNIVENAAPNIHLADKMACNICDLLTLTTGASIHIVKLQHSFFAYKIY
jgi:hypothetical protein